MKKLFFIAFGMAFLQANAQEPTDALRYSWYTSSGTARQQAIGGSMTSLGGEISSVFVNPAGIGMYKTGDLVITPGYNFLNNKATYLGRTEKDNRGYLSFGTTGVVIGGVNDETRGRTRGSAFSIAINRTANFGSNLLYRGLNTQSSYSQKFLEEIQKNNDRDANSVAQNYIYGTSLAFNTYWIDTIAGGTNGNYQFQTRAPIATGLLQQNEVVSRGGITEIAVAGAGNQNDKFYYGGTIGIPILHYDREATFTEADATDNPNNKFDFASITQNLITNGVGLNAKLGIIYKPTEFVRLGLAFHSPTFYSMNDQYSVSVITDTEGYKGRLNQSSLDFTAADGTSRYKYWYTSPYRILASASYVLREISDVRKQKGFITADVEYINYKASSFSVDPDTDPSQDSKDYFKSVNKAIDNAYKGAFNFKAGGELKFTTVMVRLGAAYYGNPYKNIAGEKGSRFQLTGGLGYRNHGFFVDLAYVHTMGKDVDYAYRLQNGFFSGATIKNTGGNAVLSVGFKI